MKKLLGTMGMILVATSFCACAENGLECNEDTFVDRCLGEDYLEICTYGERARVKCKNGCIPDDDSGHAECSK